METLVKVWEDLKKAVETLLAYVLVAVLILPAFNLFYCNSIEMQKMLASIDNWWT